MHGSKPMGSHFEVFGAPPILEPIFVGIDSDVHWGDNRGFDPWPYLFMPRPRSPPIRRQRSIFEAVGWEGQGKPPKAS